MGVGSILGVDLVGGISEVDLVELGPTLATCVTFVAATPRFLLKTDPSDLLPRNGDPATGSSLRSPSLATRAKSIRIDLPGMDAWLPSEHGLTGRTPLEVMAACSRRCTNRVMIIGSGAQGGREGGAALGLRGPRAAERPGRRGAACLAAVPSLEFAAPGLWRTSLGAQARSEERNAAGGAASQYGRLVRLDPSMRDCGCGSERPPRQIRCLLRGFRSNLLSRARRPHLCAPPYSAKNEGCRPVSCSPIPFVCWRVKQQFCRF